MQLLNNTRAEASDATLRIPSLGLLAQPELSAAPAEMTRSTAGCWPGFTIRAWAICSRRRSAAASPRASRRR